MVSHRCDGAVDSRDAFCPVVGMSTDEDHRAVSCLVSHEALQALSLHAVGIDS